MMYVILNALLLIFRSDHVIYLAEIYSNCYSVNQELIFKARNLLKKSEQDFRVNINFEQAWNDIFLWYRVFASRNLLTKD